IHLGVAALPTAAADVGDRHQVDVALIERTLDGLELFRSDDGDDQFHRCLDGWMVGWYRHQRKVKRHPRQWADSIVEPPNHLTTQSPNHPISFRHACGSPSRRAGRGTA